MVKKTEELNDIDDGLSKLDGMLKNQKKHGDLGQIDYDIEGNVITGQVDKEGFALGDADQAYHPQKNSVNAGDGDSWGDEDDLGSDADEFKAFDSMDPADSVYIHSEV